MKSLEMMKMLSNYYAMMYHNYVSGEQSSTNQMVGGSIPGPCSLHVEVSKLLLIC